MYKNKKNVDIEPDEIFLDSSNLPSFDNDLFEGRIEKPISKRSIVALGLAVLILSVLYMVKDYSLQIVHGQYFANRSQANTLKTVPVVPDRGKIYDRNGIPLAWNELSGRTYIRDSGMAQVIGYVGLPSQGEMDAGLTDNLKEYIGKDGVEKRFNGLLRGEPGSATTEVDASGNIISEHIFSPGVAGQDIFLSLDSRVTEKFYEEIKNLVALYRYSAGSGVIMDVNNGEILAMTSYPEYDPNILSSGNDAQTISAYTKDTKKPFLNRAISGLYTPGSIVKPIFALGALNENLITPEKKIYSAGFISVPNPFDPTRPSIYKDWRVQGWVDMRRAIAVSSDVYFYALGGGFGDQKGLGIGNLDKYARVFGLGTTTGIELDREGYGNIPSPEWKAKISPSEPWRLGDTYITSIGQYGFLATPLQMARVEAAVATDGKLVAPTIFKGVASSTVESANIPAEYFKVVKEGMREGVTDSDGTARALNIPEVKVAAKTGTAELGITKAYVNSWGTGYFPYDNPRYAFAIVMEKGRRENTVGANAAMRNLLEWMAINTPEYLK